MDVERKMSIAGVIACVAAVVFAIPHFWFWFGFPLAYPGDFEGVVGGDILWIVGGFALVAAAYALAFTRWPLVKRFPEPIAALPAWVGAIGFTLWGALYFELQLQIALFGIGSAPQYAASNASPNAIWGYYWYTLFIVWGLSLGLAAFYFHKVRKQSRAGNGKSKNIL